MLLIPLSYVNEGYITTLIEIEQVAHFVEINIDIEYKLPRPSTSCINSLMALDF